MKDDAADDGAHGAGGQEPSAAGTVVGARADERQAIVAFQRQAALGANRGVAAAKGSTRRTALGGGSLALKRTADIVEAGGHLVNDNHPAAATTRRPPTNPDRHDHEETDMTEESCDECELPVDVCACDDEAAHDAAWDAEAIEAAHGRVAEWADRHDRDRSDADEAPPLDEDDVRLLVWAVRRTFPASALAGDEATKKALGAALRRSDEWVEWHDQPHSSTEKAPPISQEDVRLLITASGPSTRTSTTTARCTPARSD